MDFLSATVITRNEEQNIERCLAALKGVADEIIVVDSYSTDRTVEICDRFGCKVTKREFTGFGSQRQYAAGLTTHAYVLSIDADEVIDEELRTSLIELKNKGFAHRVYAAKVNNYLCGKLIRHGGYEPEASVRLFNKRYARWDLRDYSDKVTYSDGVTPGMLPGTIHHYRCATIDEFCLKENRIAAMQAKEIVQKGHSVGAMTPSVKAALQFVNCLLSRSAWLDGSFGLTIALRHSRTVYEAYRMARHIINEQTAL